MSLIICPECGKEISDKADACPNCGLPHPSTAAPLYYDILLDGDVPKKQRDFVMTEIFHQTGMTIDDAQRITLAGKGVVKSNMDFESAAKLHSALKRYNAPVIIRESASGRVVETGIVRCPECGSSKYEVFENGFSIGKAALGAVIAGPIGVVAGFSGSTERYRRCTSCGCRF